MSRVEVLAPVRLETRFEPDGDGGWTLHLRVYPDDFSLARTPTPPTEKELQTLQDAMTAAATQNLDPTKVAAEAFRSAATLLGARRTWWLWRTSARKDAAGTWSVDFDQQTEPDMRTAKPIGLPDVLDIWLVFDNDPTQRRLAESLHPNHAGIIADLELETINTAGVTAPQTWWLDYQRAQDVGLATAIPLTDNEAHTISTLLVVGAGTTEAMDLITVHMASGRLAPLAQGAPTNTIDGQATTAFGDDAESWIDLLETTAQDQPATGAVLRAMGASAPSLASRLPLPGGDLQHDKPGGHAVEALWPVLWERTVRDVIGTPGTEPHLARWATHELAVQGPLPAIRVGEQPYGLLPVSIFDPARWQPDPNDDPARNDLDFSVLAWAFPWLRGTAAAVAAATLVPHASPVVGAGPRDLLTLYGRHAPSTHWRVRPIADLAQLQAAQIQQGLPISHLTDYDRATAAAWHGTPVPTGPVAASGSRRHVPSLADEDDVEVLLNMLTEQPEPLYWNTERKLGLLGHLVRESMIGARATIGQAWRDLLAGNPVDCARRIPMDDDYHLAVMDGTDTNKDALNGVGGDGALLAGRFDEIRRALERLVKLYAEEPATVLRAVRAALDTASFRVDPWLIGVAGRRLRRMGDDDVPVLLGAYGWVDAPRPWTAGDPEVLEPGPTAIGLLHAPSFAQAQVAAVLRDAALRDDSDPRWDLTLTADRVRGAVNLSERVRLGVHPFEALGLEVEAVAGDPDVVRILRTTFPTTPGEADDPTRRVCDGVAVLAAARGNALPPGLPADLAERIAPLNDVLDTYADLLLVDGVHALVTRSPEAGAAAMDAAAGLATPVELRGIRTPRAASTVSVSCWVVLGPGDPVNPTADPVIAADPVVAALVTPAVLDDPGNAQLSRTIALLGGASAAHFPDEPNASVRAGVVAAMNEDLKQRWNQLADMIAEALTIVDRPAPVTEAVLDELDRKWRLGLYPQGPDWTTADRQRQATALLKARTQPLTGGAPTTMVPLQDAIRDLVGRSDLPVVPVIARAQLPAAWRDTDTELDKSWLEIVAAVRPRVAPLEAHQLTAAAPWPSAVDATDNDPWTPTGPVRVAYGPGLDGDTDAVGVVMLDAWVDSVPSRRHTTEAAFGFNAPKTRAPQAVLLAVPPDIGQPLDAAELLDVVLGVRELTLARAARPTDRQGLPWATPAPMVGLEHPIDFLDGWP